MNSNIASLNQQSDLVYSSKDARDIVDYKKHHLYERIAEIIDHGGILSEVEYHEDDFSDAMTISPLRANLYRSFDFKPGSKILEIGCGSGQISRYLAESDCLVDAYEMDRSLAQLAALNTKEFVNVKIICDEFKNLQFEQNSYDAVLITGKTDRAFSLLDENELTTDQSIERFIAYSFSLLNEKGSLYLAADNRLGIKYLFGATDERSQKPYISVNGYQAKYRKKTYSLLEWRGIIEKLGCTNYSEYYLYPDFRFTRVMLNKEYSHDNPYFFQHLEGVNSKDYFNPTMIDFPENILHQASSQYDNSGYFCNSFLFILDKEDKKESNQFDFIHLPDFSRKPEYVTLIRKRVGQDKVERVNILKQEHSSPQSPLIHRNDLEKFIPGQLLSVIWSRSLLSDSHGSEFKKLLRDYYKYLEHLQSQQPNRLNVDALASNIIVAEDSSYHLFDLEWQSSDSLTAEFVFFRAIVIFTLKNSAAFARIMRIYRIVTLSDFLHYCFEVIGQYCDIKMLENFRDKDMVFQSQVLKDSSGYKLSDILGPAQKTNIVFPYILWKTINQEFNTQQQIYSQARVDNSEQRLIFNFPEFDNQLDSFLFFPFDARADQDVGYFGVSSVKLISNKDDDVLWELKSSDEVNENNISTNAVYMAEGDHHFFMFNQSNSFLRFSVSPYQCESSQRLRLEINYHVVRSLDHLLMQKKMQEITFDQIENENIIKIQDKRLQRYKESIKILEKNIELIKSSRTWRLNQAFNEAFKVIGFPKKQNLQKIFSLFRRYKQNK